MADIAVATRPGAVAAARRVAALLLVVTAALFAVGVANEGDEHAESARTENEATELGDAHAEAGEEEAGQEDSAEQEEDGEREVLGVDPESPRAIVTAVVLSLGLAAVLWLTDRREVAWAAAAFGAVFALLDAREVGHQLDESRTGLAALAAAITIGHLGVAVAALAASRRTT